MQKSRKPATHSPSQSGSALKKTHADQMEELRAALKEKEALCVKTLGEFENYRKRTAKDGNAEAKALIRELLLDLVAVQDSFDRAFQSEALKAEPQVYQGMRSIQRQIHQLLEQRGVLTFESVGQPFSPSLHEAVDTEETDGEMDGRVIGEYSRGFRMGDRLLRPARVKVGRAPGQAKQATEQ